MLNQEIPRLRLQIAFNWKIACCVLFWFVVLLRLGFWQLDRAEQKRQLQSHRDALRLAMPVPVEALPLNDKSSLQHRQVTLNGHYENDHSILITHQMLQNQPGYEVITPFKLRSNQQIVLVSRGWISAGYDSTQLPTIEAISGIQQLSGETHLPTANSFFLPQTIDESPQWPLRLHHIYLSDISRLFDEPVLPFVVRIDQNNPGVLIRHWQVTQLKSDNSTSYAIQWFGLALILVLFTIIKSTNILEIIRSKSL